MYKGKSYDCYKPAKLRNAGELEILNDQTC